MRKNFHFLTSLYLRNRLNKISFIYFLLIFFSCDQQKPNDKTVKNIETQIKKQADSFYYAKNDLNAAVLFTKLIALDSTKGEYYYKRGYSYSMLLNADDAINDFLKAAKLNYRTAKAYRNIAVNYFTINDSLAVYYINKSLQVDPTDTSAMKLKQKYEEQWMKQKDEAKQELR